MSETKAGALILERFEALVDSLRQLSAGILNDPLPAWVPDAADNPRSIIANIYSDIWYQEEGDGRATRSLHGLVAASEHTLRQAHKVNAAKHQLQRAVQAYRTLTSPSALPDELHNRAAQLSEHLQHQGLARIHLKQCYRDIPVLQSCPDHVGFNWYCSGRSIRKVSIADAEQMLLQLDSRQPHIQRQLAALASLPSNEQLAQVQQLAPVMRANIVWKTETETIRKARNCSLPLLFPIDKEQNFPDHNDPSLTPPTERQRVTRMDSKLDPTPFLTSLRIHRYL
ncbi:hypothetical protein [Marinobacterium jannaschii]|uniref:hypothetical protein n=1 Tax=Marinobacterium jannaschii TaxID=64970 RepID=UPI0004847962|nr:hypothetical protein [Marinobacterium jannaschii]